MPTRITSIATLVLGLAAFGARAILHRGAERRLQPRQRRGKGRVPHQKIVDLETRSCHAVERDIRIYPRCPIMPVPTLPCSKTPAQTWMIRKPYQ